MDRHDLDKINAMQQAGMGAVKLTPPTSPFALIGDVLTYANELATRMEQVAGALLGQRPPEATAGTVGVSSDGALPALTARAEYTRGRLGEAMAELSRIERSLP